jgi:DNA replication protein DnaC
MPFLIFFKRTTVKKQKQKNMNTQTTIDQLRKLKLTGMASVYEQMLSLPSQDKPCADLLIAQLSEAELQYRMQRKTQLYLQSSKLRYNAIIEQVHCNPSRNLTSEQMLSIATCDFIEKAENVLITGATGCGKSYLACAIGRQACMKGYKVLYFGFQRLIEKLAQAKLDGTFVKVLNQIEKTHLLVIDDFGLHPLDTKIRLALLQILEDRYGVHPTLITSQLPVPLWHDYIGEPTLADAIMDRLSGNTHRFELKGESLRRRKIENKL